MKYLDKLTIWFNTHTSTRSRWWDMI